MDANDWSQLVLSPLWMKRMEAMARKKFREEAFVIEAVDYVIGKLSEENWSRCQSFEGRAKADTFLYTVITRELRAFQHKKFGRKTAPTWLKAKGELWVRLWKWLCLERHHIETIVDRVVSDGLRSREFVIEATNLIKGKIPWCGASDPEIPTQYLEKVDDDQTPIHEQVEDFSLEESMDLQDTESFLFTLHQLLVERIENTAPSALEDARNIMANISMDDEEWLVLKMHFQDGLKLKVIATALNLPPHKPGRILSGALKKVRASLEALNLSLDDIQENYRELL